MSTVRQALAALDRDAAGRSMMDLAAEFYTIPRSLTGDGVRATLERISRRIPLDVHELPTGTPVLDWTVPRGVEPPGGVDPRSLGPKGRRLRRPQPPPGRLQRAASPPDDAERAAAAPAQPAGTAGPDPVPHLLLRGDLGLLPAPPAPRIPAGRGVRGLHRCLARGRLDDLGRVPAARRDRRRGPRLEPRLPSPARQRQPVRNRGRGPSGGGSGGRAGAPLQLPPSVRSGRHRRDCLAGAEPRPPGHLPPRADRRQPGRYRRLSTTRRAATATARSTVPSSPPWPVSARTSSPRTSSPSATTSASTAHRASTCPSASLTRTPWGQYPEYHTSADDLSFISAEALAGSLAAYLATAAVLEERLFARAHPPAAAEDDQRSAARTGPDAPSSQARSLRTAGGRRYRNLEPFGEPQLGRRGLYGGLGGAGRRDFEIAMLWVLNQSDGEHSLDDIAERSGLPPGVVGEAAEALREAGLLEEVE